MKRAYLSMPADTPAGIINRLSTFIMSEYSVDDLSFWKKGTRYSDSRLRQADLIFSYIPPFQFEDGGEGHSNVAFMGKGQFSEMEKAGKDQVFVVIDNDLQTYLIEHSVPNDYNDWKRKYGKVWLEKELHQAYPLTPEQAFQIQDEELLLLIK